jgi:hypothetical protein
VKDQEERLAFVAIDTEQYDSFFSGLEFFYPRLQEGGGHLLACLSRTIYGRHGNDHCPASCPGH